MAESSAVHSDSPRPSRLSERTKKVSAAAGGLCYNAR